ncbi:hypothetical protein [Mycolicibacterium sp. OfavD-34-C]|uniref:hypothetical protein n=1 Tax=Mycolicibacterium sp. OfavD-34-C TaxID=2917746 RepID=UPI001EF63D04|nr:hypothetical protein [Mycolicibacterium sp. OfavD-34-C]MCG7578737.1 hypothetical protein [Mycolicibacterium sp. OfavD-34-C]
MSDSVDVAGAGIQWAVSHVIDGVPGVDTRTAVDKVLVAQAVIAQAVITEVVVSDAVNLGGAVLEAVVPELFVLERVVIRRVRFIGGGFVSVGARRAASGGLVVSGRCTVRGDAVCRGRVGASTVRRGGSRSAEKHCGSDTR